MGFLPIHLSSMLVVFLVLQIDGTFGRPSTKITIDELPGICSTTLNPTLCFQSLASDPRTFSADLKGLAQISIDMAKANATATASFIASVAGKATNRQLKERYQSCAIYFNRCIGSLDGCTKAASSGDFSGLQSQASASLDGPVSCGDSFQRPPADPARVSDKCQIIEQLISIILAIAKLLIK